MIRIGILGLDSTHALEWTRRLNRADAPVAWRGARIVAACGGEATDFPLSVARRGRIAQQLQEEEAIPLLPTSAALMEAVDAVMVLSCDGRCHVPEAMPLLKSKKPLFVDKPLAADWRQAADLVRAAVRQDCPLLSASALRYRFNFLVSARLARELPTRVDVAVPDGVMPGHPDFSWLGIHGVETAFGALGPGCREVRRVHENGRDTLRASWESGAEVSIARTDNAEARDFPAQLTFADGCEVSVTGFQYEPLLTVITTFFAEQRSPLSPGEMLEVIAVIAAADLSRDRGGAPIDVKKLISETAGDL